MGSNSVLILISIGCIGLLCAGVLTAVETAIFRLSHAAVQDLIDENRRGARALAVLVDERRRTEVALRGGTTVCQVLFAVCVTLGLTPLSVHWWVTALIAVVIIGVCDYLVVALGAIYVGERKPSLVALRGVKLTRRIVWLSRMGDPVLHFIQGHRAPVDPTKDQALHEVAQDLREIVDEVAEPGEYGKEDREMLRSVFELGQTIVREVMVPRPEMITIAADVPAPKALRLFVRSGFSRIPVTGDDVDDIRGILYFKDVVQRVDMHGYATDLTAEQMMRRAEFTIEMKRADDLLRSMQENHFHMALVVDEYGGISGLVTLEDILEELVGEVTDEHDHNILEPEEISPGLWRVPSRLSIDELGELLGIDADDDDVDSVGGLLGKAIGRVPLPGARGEILGVHMVAGEARGRRRQAATILCTLNPRLLTEDSVRMA